MAYQVLRILRQIYRRCMTYRMLNRLEEMKLNAIRKGYGLGPRYHYSDQLCVIMCYPFALIWQYLCIIFSEMISSVSTTSPSGSVRRTAHIQRAFIGSTAENRLFVKVMCFMFGATIAYLLYKFMTYQDVMSDTKVILITISLMVLFALIAPFKSAVLCLTLLAVPSLFASKLRYVLIAYIMYAVFTTVLPNTLRNARRAVGQVGCTAWQTTKGGAQVSRLIIKDVEEFVTKTQAMANRMCEEFKNMTRKLAKMIKLPNIGLKNACKHKSDQDIIECENNIMMFNTSSGRVYVPGVCSVLVAGVAELCQGTKRKAKEIYNETKAKMMDKYRNTMRELTVKVELNPEFDFKSVSSVNVSDALHTVGRDFARKHYVWSYLKYVLNVKFLFIFLVSSWITINSVLYWYLFRKSDAYDNFYTDEELVKIDKLRESKGLETIFPLEFRERKTFIGTFDLTMTDVELRRFVIGGSLFLFTLSQVGSYMTIDWGIYWVIKGVNKLIDIIIDFMKPAGFTIEIKGDDFFSKSIRNMNKGLDVKQAIVSRLKACKEDPEPPNMGTYKNIAWILAVVVVTLFSGSYGLRSRHYVAGLFYPQRIPIRAVWLYNNILNRRGNIFQFWRKQLRRQLHDKREVEVSFFERLCAQYRYVRIVATLLGFYGQHKYCVVCGSKVLPDSSDQSLACANHCGSYYCFNCVGEQNNMCKTCMNPIDYSNIGDVSEELDSSDEDIAYTLQNEDYYYQYEEPVLRGVHRIVDQLDEYDPNVHQRQDLVSLAYDYDTVRRVPTYVYLVDEDRDGGNDADDEADGEPSAADYQRYLFQLERELNISAEEIVRLRNNAKHLMTEEMDENVMLRGREEKYSNLKRDDDERLVRNAMLFVNRDRKKHKNKTKTKTTKQFNP